MESNCRFFKKGVCAYKHVNPITVDKNLEMELDHLKREIAQLEKEVELKQKQLDEVIAEKTDFIQKLFKDKKDMENLVVEIKRTHVEALEKKNVEIETIHEQNNCLKAKIIEMSKEKLNCEELAKLTPSETTSIRDVESKKIPDDYECDKCEFSTSTLGILIKHKADVHKPGVYCDKCDFKTMKKSDLTLHILFKH